MRPISGLAAVKEAPPRSAAAPAPEQVSAPDSKGPESASLKPLVLPRPSVSSEVVLRPLDDPPAISEPQADLPVPADSSSNEESDKPTEGAEAKKESLPAFPALP